MKCVACACRLHAGSNFCHACGSGVVDLVAYRAAREMAKDQPRTAKARKVIANLTKKQMGRMKGLTKQAGSFLDDVPISTKTFPDSGAHRAAARLTDVLLDVLEVMRPLAEMSDDAEAIQIIDEVSERLDIQEHGLEHEQLQESGFEESMEEEPNETLDLDNEYDEGKEVEIDEDYDDDTEDDTEMKEEY